MYKYSTHLKLFKVVKVFEEDFPWHFDIFIPSQIYIIYPSLLIRNCEGIQISPGIFHDVFISLVNFFYSDLCFSLNVIMESIKCIDTQNIR